MISDIEGQLVELHHGDNGEACVGNACKESHNTASLGSWDSHLKQANSFTDLDARITHNYFPCRTGRTAQCAIEASLTIYLIDQSAFPADCRNGH